jgi:hypothetical protein
MGGIIHAVHPGDLDDGRICSPLSIEATLSQTLLNHSTALFIVTFARNTNAFRLHMASDSAARKVCISSAASGTKDSCSRWTVYEGEDGSFADIRMTVFEVSAESGDERLEEFDVFGKFLEEAEGCAADIFVWVLLANTRVLVCGQLTAERDVRDHYGWRC